jgi:hypothetical protein
MKKSKQYQIYCDMDGVLVDFEGAAIEQINKDIKDESITCDEMICLRNDLSKIGRELITHDDLEKIKKEKRLPSARKYMYHRFANDEDFWANLPWTSGGKELWEFISKYNPHILTAPMDDDCKKGKFRWIEKNLTPQPEQIFMSHDKYKWASSEDGQSNILIDDFTINTIPWDASGGISILYINVDDAIKELKELINETYTT